MSLAAIPHLGSGLGFRDELAGMTLAARQQIDFVEIVTERFAESPATLDQLRGIVDVFPVIPHGLGLSIGSAGPVDAEYLAQIKRISDVTGSPYYSDHLCMTRTPGIDLGLLAPMWFSASVLRGTIDRVNAVQDALGKPLVLENVTYLFEIPDPGMSQPEFFHRLVDATGCGILLDVTNVYTNAVNHGFDAERFLSEMPLDSVVQAHLAGGFWDQGVLADSHSHPVPPPVWDLFALLCKRTGLKAALVEFDQNFPDFGVLIDQVATARQIMTAPS
jgi:uncharacterized protein (UPF0276 family)